SGQKVRHRGEPESANVLSEVIVQETPDLTTELERVSSVQITGSVGYHERGVPSTLRETGRTAKVEPDPAHSNLRQSERLVYAIVDPELGRIQQLIGRERDVYSVESETRFVHQILAKCVGLDQGEYLAMRLP